MSFFFRDIKMTSSDNLTLDVIQLYVCPIYLESDVGRRAWYSAVSNSCDSSLGRIPSCRLENGQEWWNSIYPGARIAYRIIQVCWDSYLQFHSLLRMWRSPNKLKPANITHIPQFRNAEYIRYTTTPSPSSWNILIYGNLDERFPFTEFIRIFQDIII